MKQQPQHPGGRIVFDPAGPVRPGNAQRARLGVAILAHALMRIASSASATIIGIWLALLARHNPDIGASLVGALAASAYAAELVGSMPLGILSDAVSVRGLMGLGALLGAVATALLALTARVPLLFLSRVLEGLAVAAVAPALLKSIADWTGTEPGPRSRLMSGFEVSLLAGLAVGGLLGAQLWLALQRLGFAALAVLYAMTALLLLRAPRSAAAGYVQALRGLRGALANRRVRQLAPIWLCVNAIIGVWLGSTLSYVLTERPASAQYLDGFFAAAPGDIGWLLLGYTIVFGCGVALWSRRLPVLGEARTMRVSLWAMLGVCAALALLNHSASWPAWSRAVLDVVATLLIMVESGFGPAALSWLAQALGAEAGAGAAMGVYSMLLGLGALAGSLLGGWTAARWRMDGLLLVTAVLAGCAQWLLVWLPVARTDAPGAPGAHSMSG